MKLKSLMLGFAALAISASSVLADVNIYLTGSTAFRSAVYNSIRDSYDKSLPSFSQNTLGSANNSGATNMTWTGVMTNSLGVVAGGQTINVFASWTGSAEGVRDVVTPIANVFLSSPVQGNVATTTHNSDIAFSDVFQATTGFTAQELVDEVVGIVPFVFAANKSVNTDATSLTSISHQQAITLLANGKLKLSFFTGNAADASKFVYLSGRAPGSGTRQTVFADTSYGALSATRNYRLVSGVWTQFPVSNDGHGSGGSSGVAGSLNAASNNGAAIGYMGIADNATVNGGANALAYEGVPYSQAAVRGGQYSLWGYEHLMYLSLSSDQTDVKDTISGRISFNIGGLTSPGIADDASMKVQRFDDGGALSTK